jgi:hypothetical protein
MKNLEQLDLREKDGRALLSVKVVPGASRDKIVGALGDALKVTTSAAPEKGKANAAIAQVLADALNVDRRSIQLVSGPTNSHKEFLFTTLTVDQLRRRLESL